MKLIPRVRIELSKRVIAKWSRITGNNVDLPLKEYLSCADKGFPKDSSNKKKWSIRDCLLNEPSVRKYISKCDTFRGENLEEKISKFNGLKFYHTVYLNSGQDCPMCYLDVYSILLDFADFKTFVKKAEFLSEDERKEQLSKLTEEKDSKEILNTFLKERRYKRDNRIPEHFCGFYKGYFIKPQHPNEGLNRFSEITILITNTSLAYARTLSAERVDNISDHFYSGICYSTNNFISMHIEFSVKDKEGNLFELMFVFDTLSRKEKSRFEDFSFLRGTFCGSDVTTRKPVAGRLIVFQDTSWGDLMNLYSTGDGVQAAFLASNSYGPSDTKERLAILLEEYPDRPNELRNFFTTEKRYIEDISIIKQYIRSPKVYKRIEGEFSIYSLSSNSSEIKRGIARISDFGEVTIKGSKISDSECKIYHGWVTLLKNEILSIVVNRVATGSNIQESEVISYLLKINQNSDFETINLVNGIRMMTASDESRSAFAGRVLFKREQSGFFDDNANAYKMNLFRNTDDNSENAVKYKAFEELEDRAIFNLLVGFENNILKTFSLKRELLGYTRSIDYKENFFILAKYHAMYSKDPFDKVIIYLYFSYLHGNQNLYERLNESESKKFFDPVLRDPRFDKVINFKVGYREVWFDPRTIARIKFSMPFNE